MSGRAASARAVARCLPAVVAVLVLVVGCGTSSPGSSARCGIGPDLVPTCGALLGVTAAAPDMASLEDSERLAGRGFDLVYTFHDLNDVVPTPYERAVVASGRLLHIDIDARDFGSASSAVTWQGIADGDFDAELTAQARGIASLGVPVFVTFDHEPNNPARAAMGSPADYVAAWRHVHDLFAGAGADNAVWVWVVMSWPPSLATVPAMWPGNDYVDWISWDAYNDSGCRDGVVEPGRSRSFAEVALPFASWLEEHGPAAGIDVDKPEMISETGTPSMPGDPAAQAAWFEGMGRAVAQEPRIKAVAIWDHASTSAGCNFRFGREGVLSGIPWTSPSLPGR